MVTLAERAAPRTSRVRSRHRTRPDTPVLVRHVRNGIEESLHRGDIVEADANGRLIRSLGDPDRVVTLRSTVKPFGVVALIEAGGIEAFDLEPAELAIIGQPNVDERRLENPIIVPRILSFLAYGSFGAEVKGLNDIPRDQWPDNVELLYFSYHIMVGLGTLLILVMFISAFALWRGTLYKSRGTLWMLMLAFPFPYIATSFGWLTAELGRQPWVVYGLMRTEHATSPRVADVTSPSQTAIPSGPGRRILVVDDNRDSAESMGEMPRLVGNEVTLAHDGEVAVERARALRPEVILMDVGMPRLNGYEATRRIRGEPWGKDIAQDDGVESGRRIARARTPDAALQPDPVEGDR